jgi:hypothetical protein
VARGVVGLKIRTGTRGRSTPTPAPAPPAPIPPAATRASSCPTAPGTRPCRPTRHSIRPTPCSPRRSVTPSRRTSPPGGPRSRRARRARSTRCLSASPRCASSSTRVHGRPVCQTFESVPIPANAVPASGPDVHMTVWQPFTDRLWEFFNVIPGRALPPRSDAGPQHGQPSADHAHDRRRNSAVRHDRARPDRPRDLAVRGEPGFSDAETVLSGRRLLRRHRPQSGPEGLPLGSTAAGQDEPA